MKILMKRLTRVAAVLLLIGVFTPVLAGGRPSGYLLCEIEAEAKGDKSNLPLIIPIPFTPGSRGGPQTHEAQTPGDAARICLSLGGHPVGIVID